VEHLSIPRLLVVALLQPCLVVSLVMFKGLPMLLLLLLPPVLLVGLALVAEGHRFVLLRVAKSHKFVLIRFQHE
jgi:hypothetical protein